MFDFQTLMFLILPNHSSMNRHEYSAVYRRVPGIRSYVILHPYEKPNRISNPKIMTAIKRGIAVEVDTWGHVREKVSAWLEQAEGVVPGASPWTLLTQQDEDQVDVEQTRQSFTVIRDGIRESCALMLLTTTEF